MSTFIYNQETEIVIYGYSVNGRAIAEKLRKHSLHVKAFFDRNARALKDSTGIEIIHPEEGFNRFSPHIDNLIIIISIANVFEHRSIAMNLLKQGFKKIIFFPDFSFNQKAPEVKVMKQVFKTILEGNNIPNEELNTFVSMKKHLNSIVIEENAINITVLIPIELIHIGNQEILLENIDLTPAICKELEKLPYYFNTPLAGFNYYLDLYEFFEGKNNNGFNSYFKWKQAMNPGTRLIENERKRMLKDRFSVYQNMTDTLAANDNFFTLNPVELKFNMEGYFYLVDGANRTCFYLNKGLRFIPAKLDIDSYNAWTKGGLNANEKQYLIGSKLLEEYPINIHPVLYASAPSPSLIQYHKYLKICRYLSANAINLENSKVLVINSTNSYFSMFFSRIKTQTTSYVLDDKFKEYNALINKLCFSKKINIVTGNLDKIVIKEQYDIIAYLDENDAIWESPEKEHIFIRNSSAPLVFWTCKSDETAERFEKYFKGYYQEKLHQYCGKYQQCYNVYAFYKKKISK